MFRSLSLALAALRAVAWPHTLGLLLLACSGSAADPTDRVSVVRPTEPESVINGTWTFDVEASPDVAEPLRRTCATNSGGYTERAHACFREIAAESKSERVRFTKRDDGLWTRTLFTREHSSTSERVFLEVPLELVADGPARWRARVAGEPTGEHAEQFARANIEPGRIELIDARTIAILDPKKGRLVFTKD